VLRYRLAAMASVRADVPPLHILILTDREWEHPQGGGTGTNLHGQITRWLDWGHRVTVIAGDYPGARRLERPAEGLEIHRMGTRLTVFPRAAWAVARGVGRDADVILEVINGIAFFTPLWPRLRTPRVALCHHVHQEHYVAELGLRGRVAAQLLERWPLRHLYQSTPFLTISQAARRDLITLGVPAQNIHVSYPGVEASRFRALPKAQQPTLLYLGRLKQYKRIETLFDVLEALPEAVLEIAGDGDHRSALEAEILRRNLSERVRMYGFVDEVIKNELYSRAWVSLTASSAEGWGLTVMEAACCGTPSAALRVGGLPESIVDGETGVLADDSAELIERVSEVMRDPQLRQRLSDAARTRALGFTWERVATDNLALLGAAADTAPRRLRERVRGRLGFRARAASGESG
jgi:glycosyltransferase involved in cell wall biosynthesis